MSPIPSIEATCSVLPALVRDGAQIAPMFTAAAAVFGVIIAFLGLLKWHPESVGKRKIELAEDILAGTYRVRDVINYARHPAGHTSEGRTRPGRHAESEVDAVEAVRDAYYTPIERLEKEVEAFAELRAKKHRARAHFGADVEKALDELQRLRAKIVSAAGSLIRNTPPQTEGIARHNEKLMGIIYDSDSEGASGEDHIRRQLDAIVSEVERLVGGWLRREERRWL